MVEIINWEQTLNTCKYDKKVGIKIKKLAGDSNFSTFITIIDPHKWVNPHYHKHGDEHYHIISGKGSIQLKHIVDGIEETHMVNTGESFVVPENVMHQLINTGNEPLILMFSCPMEHLDSDRYLT